MCDLQLDVYVYSYLQLSVSHRFLQQGLCQKEKPLDNSLYSDGIGTDIGAHLFLLPRTLS